MVLMVHHPMQHILHLYEQGKREEVVVLIVHHQMQHFLHLY